MNTVARDALNRILSMIDLNAEETGGNIEITGNDPIVPSRHRLGVASAAALAAQGAAVAAIWKQRSGRGQDISVDVRRAVIPGLRTTVYVRQNGSRLHKNFPARTTNFFRTKDDRVIYILRTPVYPNVLFGLLDLLECRNDDEIIKKAVSNWKALDLEDAINEKRLFAVIARTKDEWRSHPQGRWLMERPAIDIDKLGDSDPETFTSADRPLSGIRVLDMTHVLAGPVLSRTLAEQGAEVLHVSAPYQSDNLTMILDTGIGKRSAYLDMNEKGDIEHLKGLVKDSDIFVQSWRPGVLDKYGLSPEELISIRPGLIYVSVSCYGSGGPWINRGGYEPLGQTACGLAVDEGSADFPRLQPTGTMNDYLVPYLGSAGTLSALIRRSREGGSYHVKLSLTRASMFIQELGPLCDDRPEIEIPELPSGSPELGRMESPYGEIEYALPITQFSETKACWDKPPEPPGASKPVWG